MSTPSSVTSSPPPTGSGTTMSLAILPSAPMACGQTTAPARLPSTPSKRPKLSLNTSNVPTTFSKSGTGLRLDTLSATSPTVRNTFRNAYTFNQPDGTSKPQQPLLSSIVTNIVPLASQFTPTVPAPADESSSSLSPDQTEAPASSASATSASTIESFTNCVPYKLAYNVASVLKNGPLPRNNHRARMSLPSRPIFPAAKKVSFRAPLTEDVQTTKYTLRHSDIESSVSTISTLELTPAEDGSSVDLDHEDKRNEPESIARETDVKDASVARAGDKRDSSDDEEDSDTCPATPVAGRRKRGRLWAWTLSPVEPQNTPPTSDDDVATAAAAKANDGPTPTANAATGGA